MLWSRLGRQRVAEKSRGEEWSLESDPETLLTKYRDAVKVATAHCACTDEIRALGDAISSALTAAKAKEQALLVDDLVGKYVGGSYDAIPKLRKALKGSRLLQRAILGTRTSSRCYV